MILSRVEAAAGQIQQTMPQGMTMLRNQIGSRAGTRVIQVCSLALLLAIHVRLCGAQGAPGPTTQATVAAQPGNAAPSNDILLRPGDTINVTVYDTPSLTETVRVSENGTVDLPLLGDVQVAGLSEAAASHRIDQKYIEAGILLPSGAGNTFRPETTVLIRDFASRGVSILGEVVKPGIYPVAGPRSLVDVLALAGGLTPTADTHVTIQHGDGTSTIATVSIPREDGAKVLADDVQVQPGDKVIAPRAGIVYVLGEVGHPGGYIMQHDGRITVLQALAAAEGTTRYSNEKNAFLIRRTGETYQTEHISIRDMYKGKEPDEPLNPQDVLYVPISNLRNFVFNAPGILGSLAGAAIYSIHN
jgi:polysaccharide export outer membrane protein